MAKNSLSHEPIPAANATATTVAVIYVVCATSIALAPDLAMQVARSWFHGIQLEEVSSWSVSPESLILGFVTATVSAWLVGFLFATLYSAFAKK